MEKSDCKSTSGRTEKQFAVYRRNRKRIGVKSAVRGKVILQPQGKEFFTSRGNDFFT